MSGPAQYVATFFTHYDAVHCLHSLRGVLEDASLAPVPRELSSSCGTCLFFKNPADPLPSFAADYEQLFRAEGGGYVLISDMR